MPPPPPAATVADMRSQPINRQSELTLFSRTSLEGASPAGLWKKAFAFFGPGYLVAFGYMDPGNWATGIAAGSAFGYDLLFIVLLSNLMAMVLQALAAKLGIVTGLDLAQACRERYSSPVRIALWLLCEVAIVACDLAEVIGTAIIVVGHVASCSIFIVDGLLLRAMMRFYAGQRGKADSRRQA